MTETESPGSRLTETGAYHKVVQFYSRQMRLLDRGKADEWARTFTEDGVFEEIGGSAPVRGRAAIGQSALAHIKRDTGLARRHWLGMIDIEEWHADRIETRCYALVIVTAKGQRPEIRASIECADSLLPGDDGFLVLRRQVKSDSHMAEESAD